jgi:hypothetical protein
MALAFVLDEHLRGPLWQAILMHNLRGGNPLDVIRVGDAPDLPLGASDLDVLAWAEQERRILVTEDRHTMIDHLSHHLSSGHHSSGVLIARAGQSIRALLECLVLIAYAGDPLDFADVTTYIP